MMNSTVENHWGREDAILPNQAIWWYLHPQALKLSNLNFKKGYIYTYQLRNKDNIKENSKL